MPISEDRTTGYTPQLLKFGLVGALILLTATVVLALGWTRFLKQENGAAWSFFISTVLGFAAFWLHIWTSNKWIRKLAITLVVLQAVVSSSFALGEIFALQTAILVFFNEIFVFIGVLAGLVTFVKGVH